MSRDLVVRAMTGDHEAFSELVRLRIDRLFAIARLILSDSQRAEDATQEALVTAWRDLAALRDPDRFDAWLRRLLVRECYRHARLERRRRRIEIQVYPIDRGTPDVTSELVSRVEIDALLARLTPDQRALIVMHFYVGLPLPETALALGLPVGTAKSRLHRTLQQMRATLEADARLRLSTGSVT
jgi:RNA polymerase sigma-70 factor (ECF subfamily)